MRAINLIVIHCTASRCTSSLTPVTLDAEHRRRGFNGCGYHYYIARDGTMHPMRDITLIGAHAKGHNTGSIGIAYEGGLDAAGKATDTRTSEQKQALVALLRHLLTSYPNITGIVGHRDLSPDLNENGEIEPQEWIKVCPCFDASAEYAPLLVRNEMQPHESVDKQLEPELPSKPSVSLPSNQLNKEGKAMKPFWKTTLNVLKFICKVVTWITDRKKDDTPASK